MFSAVRSYVARHHVAMLALFVALGGTSVAAARLPARSVGTKQIKAGAITGSKIAGNAITSAKVKNGSLKAADFASGQIPAGPQGAAGHDGAPGSPGVSGLHIVTADSTTDTTSPKVAVASCAAGEAAVGGGGQVFTSVANQQDAIRTSGPVVGGNTQPTTGVPDGWRVNAVQSTADTTNSFTVRAYALCAHVAP
jgi:hypothetical protein